MNETRQLKERMLSLTREQAQRRAEDPLVDWIPHPRQKDFIDAVFDVTKPQENWFIGANRSGKSDVGAYIGANYARFGNPNQRYVNAGDGLEIKDKATSGWVVALDTNVSRDTVQPKYFDNGFASTESHKPFIPDREIEEKGWHITHQVLKLKNGSIIGFKNCESERIKFQGTGKDWIHFDEEPNSGVYEECMIRVGVKPLNVFGTCTLLPPEGSVGGVSWVFHDIIQPWQQGRRKDVGIYGASIYDNPFILESELRRLESLYPEGSIQRRIRLNGEMLPGLSGARAYTAFDRLIHMKEQEKFWYPRRPLCWIWDFNVEPMVSLVGQKDGFVFRFFKEFLLEEGSIPDMVDKFKETYPSHGAEIIIYGDATGKHRHAQSKWSNYQVMLNSMRGYPAPLRMCVPEANPPVTSRINSMNSACRSAQREINIQVDPSMYNLVADFEGVLLSNDGKIKKTSNKRDPYYRLTHTSDAAGYWVCTDSPVGILAPNLGSPVHVPRPGYSSTRKRRR